MQSTQHSLKRGLHTIVSVTSIFRKWLFGMRQVFMYLLDLAWKKEGSMAEIQFVETTQTVTKGIIVPMLMERKNRSTGQVCHTILCLIWLQFCV